jgi:hypothetical protein
VITAILEARMALHERVLTPNSCMEAVVSTSLKSDRIWQKNTLPVSVATNVENPRGGASYGNRRRIEQDSKA